METSQEIHAANRNSVWVNCLDMFRGRFGIFRKHSCGIVDYRKCYGHYPSREEAEPRRHTLSLAWNDEFVIEQL